MKAFTRITQNRIAEKIRAGSKTTINRINQGNTVKVITMTVLGLIATASLIVMIIFAVRISHLASSAFEETESSDITYKVEAAGVSSEAVARLVPLVQAFSGDTSIVVQGTTDLDPGTTIVTIPGIDIDLNANTDSQHSVEISGWGFTQQYTTPDEVTSETVMSDNSDNSITFVATRPLEYDENPSDPTDYIVVYIEEYSSIFALLGFDVSPAIIENQIYTIKAEQEGTVIEMRVWIDPDDTEQVNIALLKSTPEDKSIASEDFAIFAALLDRV